MKKRLSVLKRSSIFNEMLMDLICLSPLLSSILPMALRQVPKNRMTGRSSSSGEMPMLHGVDWTLNPIRSKKTSVSASSSTPMASTSRLPSITITSGMLMTTSSSISQTHCPDHQDLPFSMTTGTSSPSTMQEETSANRERKESLSAMKEYILTK